MDAASAPIASVTLRSLAATDAKAMTDLVASLSFAEQFQRFGRLLTRTDITTYVAQACQRQGFMLGVFDGPHMVALAEAVPNRQSGANALDVAMIVSSQKQGRGLGTALLSATIRFAAEQHYRALYLAFPPDHERLSRITTRLAQAPVLGQSRHRPLTLVTTESACDHPSLIEICINLDPQFAPAKAMHQDANTSPLHI